MILQIKKAVQKELKMSLRMPCLPAGRKWSNLYLLNISRLLHSFLVRN